MNIHSGDRLTALKALSLVGVLALAVLILTLWFPYGAATQNGKRKRIIEEAPYPACPVKIIAIANSRYPIKSKEPFLEDDDWLKGLKIAVVNKSDQTVTHVDIRVWLERPPEQAGKPPGFWGLTYGRNPFSIGTEEAAIVSKSKSEIKPIQPNHTAIIQLSDQQYEGLQGFLKELDYSVAIEKIKLWVSTVGFDDGTAWAGSYYVRDPNAPHGWRLKGPPPSFPRKSSAFPFSEPSYHHRNSWKNAPASGIEYFRLQVDGCGYATISSYNCNPFPGCQYERVIDFNS